MKRLAFAAAAVAVIAYIVDNAYHFMWEEEDANAAKVIASIRAGGVPADPAAVAARYRYYEQITGPGWQR
jgi:hypothetical protein